MVDYVEFDDMAQVMSVFGSFDEHVKTLEKALEVMDYHRYELPQFQDETVVKDTYTCRILSRCKYFECASYQIHGTAELPAYSDSFSSLVCVKGSGILYKQDEKMQFSAGDSFFVPCSGEKIRAEGDCELILTHI